MTNTFIKGMDVSTYPEMIDLGYKYYDYDQMIFDLHLGDLQYFAAMSKAIAILKLYE